MKHFIQRSGGLLVFCEPLDRRRLLTVYLASEYAPSTNSSGDGNLVVDGSTETTSFTTQPKIVNGVREIVQSSSSNQQSEDDYLTYSSKTGYLRVDADIKYSDGSELNIESLDGIPFLPAKLETGKTIHFSPVPMQVDYSTSVGELTGNGTTAVTLKVVGTGRVDGEYVYPNALEIVRQRDQSYSAKTQDGSESLSVQEEATFDEWYVSGLGEVKETDQFNETITVNGKTQKKTDNQSFELTDSTLVPAFQTSLGISQLRVEGSDQSDTIDILPDGKKYLLAVVDGVGKEFPKSVKRVSVIGDAGDDVVTIEPDAPRAYIDGGDGNDLLTGGDGNDTITGGAGKNTIYGGNGDDRLHGSGGRDLIFGQTGDDRIYGNGGNDTLDGGGGIDHLYGGTDDDSLIGGGSNDKLYGEEGNDTLLGQGGGDLLDGGAGTNTAVTDADDTLLNIQDTLSA